MTDISRRQLVKTGLLLTSVSALGYAPMAFAQSDNIGDAAKKLPREQLLFDVGWKFIQGHGADPTKDLGFGYGQADFSKTGNFKFAKAAFDVSGWRSVDLPHDWGVELPFVRDESGEGDNQLRSHGFKPLGRRYPETSVGWYRREFDIPAGDLGRRIWVEFDGAFRDVMVFVNGCFIGRNNNGYVPFRFDLTDYLAYGAKNCITVRVDASFGDGWFYEGAGIYRHVWLTKTDAVNLGRWESTVRSSLKAGVATLALATIVENHEAKPAAAKVSWIIRDARGITVATAETADKTIAPEDSVAFEAATELLNPALWSVENPNLYTATVTVETNGKARDGEVVTFGVRTAIFTADKGFFLNGKNLKIQGVCNHQDHAGVGAALPDRLQAFRVEVMQDMGCNAIRSSHNMPTPELVEACDRMGVMMMVETRSMSSSPEGLAQLETMIKRYRNSPSVIIWSIGNEENALQGELAEQGAKIARTMVALCHELDPTRPVTAAVNADNEKGPSEAVDVIGFNYHREFPDNFHQRHPERPVICTEDASDVATRGEYSMDWKRNVASSFDGDVPWKKSPENWWKFYATRDWAAGGFAWTGFDYRGEPSPFGWPSINSNFGIVDTCGFPKDYFYYYKAWWGKTPTLHLFPHWDWAGKEGQDIPVWVYSNLDEVELFLNGKSLGVKAMPLLGHLEWQVKYAPGAIEARGRKGGKVVLKERRETTGAAKTIRLTAERTTISADGVDIAILKAEVVDARGRHIPTANSKLKFKVSGAGLLIGVGNGDPNCLESDKGAERSLYNGLAQLIVQSKKQPGTITVEAYAEGGDNTLKATRMELKAMPAITRASVPPAV
ncbi:Beta-galactosidase BoGH2A (plasmid) [Asticcacaulis sp. MM231]|uniref:beta-galactosidase GalA n=1 Tax=Asticcacaulis sp. MM231 TaxID=3157666 RepID=UPI0032D59D42